MPCHVANLPYSTTGIHRIHAGGEFQDFIVGERAGRDDVKNRPVESGGDCLVERSIGSKVGGTASGYLECIPPEGPFPWVRNQCLVRVSSTKCGNRIAITIGSGKIDA